MTIKRFARVQSVIPSDDWNALLFSVATTDGEVIELEFLNKDLEFMLRPLLAGAHAIGEKRPTSKPLKDVQPNETVLIPSEQLAVTTTPQGALWMMLRAGSVDLSVAFPDSRGALTLAAELQKGR